MGVPRSLNNTLPGILGDALILDASYFRCRHIWLSRGWKQTQGYGNARGAGGAIELEEPLLGLY